MANKRFSFRSLAPNDFKAVEKLFGAAGACGGCWCMYWRVPSTGKYWEEHKGAPNRRAFKRLVESGRATGVLAFDGADAVAWCSVGPRQDFAYLARARKLPPAIDEATWSITCFFIRRDLRNAGLARDMLKTAIALAKKSGGAWLEGYPSTPSKAGARIPDAFAHTGVPSLFEDAGFMLAAKAGARCVYRLKL